MILLETNQPITPVELPVTGDPYNEIALDLTFPKPPAIFALKGKRLQLLAPLDRDTDNLSHIVFHVSMKTRVGISITELL